jgi:transcriptional antiterminator Rof (Rho-off)
MSDYHPIACAQHSLLELAILRGQRIEAAWQEPGGPARQGPLLPLDLSIHEGAEWLDALDETGRALRLRLDRMVTVRMIPP